MKGAEPLVGDIPNTGVRWNNSPDSRLVQASVGTSSRLSVVRAGSAQTRLASGLNGGLSLACCSGSCRTVPRLVTTVRRTHRGGRAPAGGGGRSDVCALAALLGKGFRCAAPAQLHASERHFGDLPHNKRRTTARRQVPPDCDPERAAREHRPCLVSGATPGARSLRLRPLLRAVLERLAWKPDRLQ